MRVTNQMMTNYVIGSTGHAKDKYFDSVRKLTLVGVSNVPQTMRLRQNNPSISPAC